MYFVGEQKLDAIKSIRLLAASLLMLVAVIYLIVAALVVGLADLMALYGIEIAVFMALFGLVYITIGIGLFRDKRLFNYLGTVVPLVPLLIKVTTIKTEPILLLSMAFEIAAILCCSYLIIHKTRKTQNT